MSRKDREDYELQYWTGKGGGIAKGLAHAKTEHKNRLNILNSMHKLPVNPEVAVDLGPGPFAGMSLVYEAKKWILVDPLDEIFSTLVPQLDTHIHLNEYGESMSLSNDSVDLLFCCNALDHADDYPKCIREIFRVLKAGGLFCVVVDCRTKDQLNIGHVHPFTPNEIEKEFVGVGFKVLSKKDSHGDGARKGYRTFTGVLQKKIKNGKGGF